MFTQVLYNIASTIYGFIGTGKRLESLDIVLILGGSNELGINICTQLCDKGIKVINVDTSDAEASLRSKECYTFIPCKGFTDTLSVQKSMQAVKALNQPVSIMINNVQKDLESIYQVNSHPLDESIDGFKECVAANLTNVMIATKFFLGELVPQTITLTEGKCRDYYLVNLSTILTLNVPEQASHYVSSKAALNQFHDSLTSELKCSIHSRLHFKTLLVFMPYFKKSSTWSGSTFSLSQELIECLQEGRRGEVLLRVDNSPLTACKKYIEYISMNPTIQAWLKTASYSIRAVCFVHVIHTYFYEFTETRGESMLPTLAASNDYVHALKKYKDGKNCRMGDCIVAVKPSDPDHRVCKRITGMPGDIILVDPSMGTQLNKSPNAMDEIEHDESFNTYIRVPKGHVWVTGENLSHSLDSRTYNSLPMGLIRGKIIAANDFNQPFWIGTRCNWWGFRKIGNSFVDED